VRSPSSAPAGRLMLADLTRHLPVALLIRAPDRRAAADGTGQARAKPT
jgi:hypothetical protein